MTNRYNPILDQHLSNVRLAMAQYCHCDLPEAQELMALVAANTSGKLIRPSLLLLTGMGCGQLAPEHYTAAAVIEMLHVASLLHDDVLDSADFRRHEPSANALYGNKTAVLMGDLLVACALQAAMTIPTRHNSQQVVDTLFRTCQGELAQQRNSGNYAITEPQYLQIVTQKTATVMACCMSQGAALANASEDICQNAWNAGLNFGVAFQIMDDINDIISPKTSGGKTIGTDFLQGKLTLPIIHHIAYAGPEATDWLKNHSQDKYDQELQQNLINRLNQTNSLTYARHKAQKQMQEFSLFASNYIENQPAKALEQLCEKVMK